MKKIFLDFATSSKRKEKREKRNAQESISKESNDNECESVAEKTTTKNFRVKELLKDSELRYIENQQQIQAQIAPEDDLNDNTGPGRHSQNQRRQRFCGRTRNRNGTTDGNVGLGIRRAETEGNYVLDTFLDSVVDNHDDVDLSWLETNSTLDLDDHDHDDQENNKPKYHQIAKMPDMREYFEKRSITANVHGGDGKMLKKLFWFREKECDSLKTKFLSKSLLQFRKSRHFTQIFAYLSKKLDMPAGSNVRSIAWSNCDGFLACGCDTGLVKVLKIEVLEQQNGQDSGNGGHDHSNLRGYLAAPTNLSKNQTLNGHTGCVSTMEWNHEHKKLTTTDSNGLTVVWKLCRGVWCEEMVHNKERTAVQDLSWSHCGTKICIIYVDGSAMVGSLEGARLWGHNLLSNDAGMKLTGVAWSPTGSQVVFAVSNGDILIYKEDGTFEKKLVLPSPSIQSKIQANPDHSRSRFGENFTKLHMSYEDDFEAVNENNDNSIVCICWYQAKVINNNWIVPCLAVIWEKNCIYILRNLKDEDPVITETQIVAHCGAWSPNGEYLAVGGSPFSTHQSMPFDRNFGSQSQEQHPNPIDQINVFNAFGSFLQTIKIPGSPCLSVSWDAFSLRLAAGVGGNVYFANIRPSYKFALFGSHVLVYAFNRIEDGTTNIGFWDGTRLSIQEIPGKIVDIKGNEQHCAILSLTFTGCYNVMILNTRGYPIDSMTIVTIDPFMINMAGSVLICVAANAIAIWRFDDSSNYDMIGSGSDLVARRRLRSFHIDESPSIIGDSSDETKLKEPTKDPASCADAVGQMLIVCRESGKLQIYSLPHGALMNTIDTAYEMNFRPSRIWLNMDGSQVAMIDKQGHLSVCSLGSSSIKTALGRRLDRKDVWSLIWAADHPNLICVMEKTKMYVIRNGETEEPVLTSAYLASFKNLKVTSVLLDELMFNPEDPTHDLVVTLETRALRETRRLLENHTLEEISSFVQKNSHCDLWRMLANEALKQHNLELAESSFVKAQDFAGITLVKKISHIKNPSLRNAEIACYFSNFDKAEQFYAQGDRKDLGTEMRMHLEEWKRYDSSVSFLRQKPSEADIRRISKAKGDLSFSSQDWNKALGFYETATDTSRMLECYLYLEDFYKLEKLSDGMKNGDPLLLKIAEIFKSRGMCTQAVNAYLKYDYEKPEKAIETAISLSQWNLALKVARNYSLDIVEPLLRRYVVHLLHSGQIMVAVQLMIKSNKPYGAGKLLILTALRELHEGALDIVQIKKLFVFAAMLFTYRSVKFVKGETDSDTELGIGRSFESSCCSLNSNSSLRFGRSNITSASYMGSPCSASNSWDFNYNNCATASTDEENLDVFFENDLPAQYRPTTQIYKWMRETPWRGAEAVHFLILTQSLLHRGRYEAATRTSLYLRNYWDILGKEIVNSIIALAAANSRNFSVASKALMVLETIDQEYEDLVSHLFSEHDPVDSQIYTVNCYSCKVNIPDYSTSCPGCNATFQICCCTGRPLSDDPLNIWTCQVCKHCSDLHEVKSRHSCPFCHSERLYSLENLN